MTIEPASATRSANVAGSSWKGLRLLGFSVWSGVLVGVLVYLVALPIGEVSIPVGIVFSSFFGAVIGFVCAPFVIVALRTRDAAPAKPIVLWSTAVIACCLALVLPEEYLLETMAVVGGVFVVASLVVRAVCPRIWEAPGLCHHCGYDIRASLEFGRCPECGDRFDCRPWYVSGRGDRTVRGFARRLAGRLVRYPSLPLIAVMLMRLVPLASAELVRAVRCRHIVTALQTATAGQTPFDLRACTDFAWDGVYAFGPYSGRATIENALGFSWKTAERTGIELGDSNLLLVFVHGQEVVAYETIAHGWEFAESLIGIRIAPGEAVFLIQENTPGWHVVVAPEHDSQP